MKTALNPKVRRRYWDFPTALLILAAIFLAPLRLVATDWTPDLVMVENIVVLGSLMGFALGYSLFSPVVCLAFSLAYGVFVVPWHIGLTYNESLLWLDRLTNFANRLLLALNQLWLREPVPDNTFFLLIMATLFWFLSIYAGYSLTRYAQPWRIIIPAGIALLVIHNFDSYLPIRKWYLLLYLFICLIIVSRVHILKMSALWKTRRTLLPPYLELDLFRVTLAVSTSLMIFAWVTPTLATPLPPAYHIWQRVSSPWRSMREHFNNAFSSLNISVGLVTDYFRDSLELGRGTPLSDTVVLTIQAPAKTPAGVRYYWKARVYDTYTNHWTSSLHTNQPLNPDYLRAYYSRIDGRTEASFNIETLYPIKTLFAPSQPLWVDRPNKARMELYSDGSIDIGVVEAVPFLQGGKSYEVEVSLSSATEAQLRVAGSNYPAWVIDRYLQLPDTITVRTRRLAELITTEAMTPYDKAQAITNFLRSHLSYSDTIPAPPDGQEPIDWVLFDYQKAFCNYYATAEVILLRSLGIPARLAVGYAQGERHAIDEYALLPTPALSAEAIPVEVDPSSNLFIVRQRDAHAWPEVFFPSLGWVEFEPTASQAPIIRLFGEAVAGEEETSEQEELSGTSSNIPSIMPPEDREETPQDLLQPAGLLDNHAILYLLLFLSLSLVITIRYIRLKRGSPPIAIQLERSFRQLGLQPPGLLRTWALSSSLPPVNKAYLELNLALNRLRAKAEPNKTPTERANFLVNLLPTQEESIKSLLKEYQNAVYGDIPCDNETARRAGYNIRINSYLAIIRRLLSYIQEAPTK